MISALEKKLNELFTLTQQLSDCLSKEHFDEFQKTEQLLSTKTSQLLNENSQQQLIEVIPQLKKLENIIHVLQEQASQKQASLKEQCLSLKRNKSKVNAYKKNAYK